MRVEARRLQLKLAKHCENEGRHDAILLELSKGAYVPTFRASEATPGIAVLPFQNLSVVADSSTLATV